MRAESYNRFLEVNFSDGARQIVTRLVVSRIVLQRIENEFDEAYEVLDNEPKSDKKEAA